MQPIQKYDACGCSIEQVTDLLTIDLVPKLNGTLANLCF